MLLILLFDVRLKESGRDKLLGGETWLEERFVLFGGFLEELCRLRVEEEVFENKIDEEKNRNLAENEALGKRWCQGEDVVAHWCRNMGVSAAGRQALSRSLRIYSIGSLPAGHSPVTTP